MTYNDILLLNASFQQIAARELPVQQAIRVAQNMVAIGPAIEAFNMVRANCKTEEELAQLLMQMVETPTLQPFALPEDGFVVQPWVLTTLLRYNLLTNLFP